MPQPELRLRLRLRFFTIFNPCLPQSFMNIGFVDLKIKPYLGRDRVRILVHKACNTYKKQKRSVT